MRWSWLMLSLLGCTRFGPVYPSRPVVHPTPMVADPPTSRVAVHVSMTGPGLREQLEQAIPKTGDGTLSLVGSERRYGWTRGPLAISFGSGRVVVKTRISSSVDLPISNVDLPFDVQISAEPVINPGYQLKLQSTSVEVRSDDRRLKLIDQVAGVFDRVGHEIDQQLLEFSYELRPLLEATYERVQAPLLFPMGAASGCAQLAVLGVEAAPIILADGIEKDFALIVAPSVTVPCSRRPLEPLPPLANVAMVPTGPFTVTIPVVASYAELTRGLSAAFSNGKLFFSKEHPKLYLEKPEVYESEGALVLQLHIAGPVHELGIDSNIDGDLFLVGKPTLSDNEISVPDLEPTIETRSFLLSLKAMKDGDVIKAEARKALRLDLTARLRDVREKLSSQLIFGSARECFVGRINTLDLQDLHPHQQYLRINVVVTAQAAASLPCATPLPVAAPATAQ